MATSPELATPPAASHRDRDGHAMSKMRGTGRARPFHADAPPVGSDDVNTSDPWTPSTGATAATTAQNDAEAHETAANPDPRGPVAFQADAPPVGFVEVNSWPALTATHRDADPHETSPRPWVVTRLTFHVGAPAVGSVDVRIFPLLLVTTQSDSEGQETPVSTSFSSLVFVQAVGPPVGSVDVRMRRTPIATQSFGEGQEMFVSGGPWLNGG